MLYLAVLLRVSWLVPKRVTVRFHEFRCDLRRVLPSLLPSAARSLLSLRQNVEWIPPVLRYLKVSILQSLEHMLPYQHVVQSLALLCRTAHMDDPRYRKTRKANIILTC
jgi:hypothetical protein